MQKILQNQISKYNLANIATINLNEKTIDIFKSKLDIQYSSGNLAEYPEYLTNSCELRKNPLLFLEWAKSAIVIAIPFNNLPPLTTSFPENKDNDLNGIISGYANRLDYHIYGKDIAEKILSEINGFYERSEICIDTKPVAERAIANFAKLGDIGLNRCLLINDYGASCFLVTIFLDKELPEFINTSEKECDNCQKCLKNCPTKSLDKSFKYNQCISALTIEKRGALSDSEKKSIGNNIFGCSHCISSCYNSSLPEDKLIDLEWLLMSQNSEIKKQIKSTPLEYSGITILRRNAVYALQNKSSENSLTLVKKFQKKTGSILLKSLS